MRAYVLYDSVGMFVMKGNDYLFSRWAFCCDLNFPAFCGQYIKSCIVDITNSYLLICDYGFWSSKGLRSKVQMVTKDVVKSEV